VFFFLLGAPAHLFFPPERPPAGTVDTRHLAGDPDTPLAVILAHPSLARQFGYDDFAHGDGLSSGAKALGANKGALLKQVIETLDLIKTNPTSSLNAANIDAFAGSPPPAPEPPAADDPEAASLKKEAAAVTAKLAELKTGWFKAEFFLKRFHGYLKLPIARDAVVGSNEELLTLWKLCNLAERWGIETQRVRSLIAVFNCFFDTSKITATDVLGTLRPCQVVLVRQANMSIAKYTIKSDNQLLAEFNLMEADLKPAPIRLDRPLTFHKDATADGSTQPWGLVGRIDVGQQFPWRFTTPSGTAYDLSIKDMSLEALRQWPTTADFKPKP